MKIHKKCHNHESQHPQGTERMRDEEQIMTKRTTPMKSPTHKQRRTATDRGTISERSVEKNSRGGGGGGGMEGGL